MLRFSRNKLIWVGLAIIILVTVIFTFAFMGSTVSPTPKNLPLGIVVEDEGMKMPSGEQLQLGKMLVDEIQNRKTSSVEWKVINTKEEALLAMNEKELYATIVLPNSLSQNIFSLLTNSPSIPTATILINEGMNQAGVSVATQIANGVLTNFDLQIQTQLLNQMEEMKMPVSVDVAKAVSNSITIETEKINRVAANNANGNTPALFTQLLWITTFFSSMTLFTILRRSTEGKWTIKSFASQILAGILYVVFICGVTLFLAINVLEVSVPDEKTLFMMIVYIGLCFFFLQNALLNWIGYPAAPLFILLLFFSMPILTVAPEMLPEITRDYLYSWVPFRFSLESLRDLLFFNKGFLESGIETLGVIGLVSLFLMGLAMVKPVKKREKNVENQKQAVTSH
ncbi:YhgE/Pip domain-containing protein [Fredinandcohnia humi]